MTQGKASRRAWLAWSLGFGVWTLVGLSFASQFYVSSSKAGLQVTWRQAILWALGDWYVFAVLSLPVFWVVRQFRLEGAQWRGHLMVHAAASMLFALLYLVLRAWVAVWQSHLDGAPVRFDDAVRPLVAKAFPFNLLIYWVVVSVIHALDYYRQSQARALRASELEKRLVEARLMALQMQLNPHFLFNTLHAIATLMRRDVDAADRMISRLSELLRYTLEQTERQEVTLREELDFLRRYLEIETTRFGPRLEVSETIAPGTEDALVPTLVLQPLVENAIKHGIEVQSKRGRIAIAAERRGDRLILQVSDNGPGLPDGKLGREGVGLANTRARLLTLFPGEETLRFEQTPGGGLTVVVTVPFHSVRPGKAEPET